MFRDEFWQEAYLRALHGLSTREVPPDVLKDFPSLAGDLADKSLEAYDKRFEKGRFRDEG